MNSGIYNHLQISFKYKFFLALSKILNQEYLKTLLIHAYEHEFQSQNKLTSFCAYVRMLSGTHASFFIWLLISEE